MASIARAFSSLNPQLQVPQGQLAIDWTHPVTQGLLACYVPGVSFGNNLAGINGGLLPDTATSFGGVSTEGPALVSTASNTGLILNPAVPSFIAWTRCTLLWRGYKIGTPDNNAFFIGLRSVTPAQQVATLRTNNNDGTLLGVGWNHGGTAMAINALTAMTLNAVNSFAATFITSGNVQPYLNGVATGTATGFGGAYSAGSDTKLVVNTNPQTLTIKANAACFMACMWNRDLTADEIAFLHREPYCFLIPAEYELPVEFFPTTTGKLFYGNPMSGLGVGGPFFRDPLTGI